MSFDIYMAGPACLSCHRPADDVMEENITHNVNSIAEACLVAAGAGRGRDPNAGYIERSWGRLHGWTGAEVLPIAERALVELLRPERQDEWTKLEPDNGWGSRRCVERVLRALIDAGRENPVAVVRASG